MPYKTTSEDAQYRLKSPEQIPQKPYFDMFHVSEKRALMEMGVEKIYPIHCSGDTIRSYLANSYKDKYGDGGVRLEIDIQG